MIFFTQNNTHFTYIAGHRCENCLYQKTRCSQCSPLIVKVTVSEKESRSHYHITVNVNVYCTLEKLGNEIKAGEIHSQSPRTNDYKFTCAVDKTKKSIRFGPQGALGMLSTEIQNKGIGGYSLSILIRKLHAKGFQDFSVQPIFLSRVDAETKEETLNRNVFYRSRGFEFADINMKIGHIAVKTLSQLSVRWNRQKVRPISNELTLKLALNKQNELVSTKKILSYRELSKNEYQKRYYRELGKGSLYKKLILLLAVTVIFILKDINLIPIAACTLFLFIEALYFHDRPRDYIVRVFKGCVSMFRKPKQ